MKEKRLKNKDKREKIKKLRSSGGFTLLFASLVAAVLLALGLAIFNITFKELILSSTISESQEAFAAADAGVECALFWDLEHPGYSSSIFGGSTQSIVPQGLVGYWKLDEGTGTTAFDSAGDNDGSLAGGMGESSWADGKVGPGSIRSEGSGQGVNIPDDSSLFAGNEVTITAWFNRNHTSLPHTIYSDLAAGHTPDTEYSLELLNNNNLVRFYSNDSGADPNVWVNGDIGTYFTGEWIHLAVIWNGETVKFYKNGVLEDEKPFQYTPAEKTSSNFFIGRRLGGANSFEGRIDDVRVYNRTLTTSEVRTLYNATESSMDGPVGEGSGLTCNSEDITDPSTGWDSATGWSVTSGGDGNYTVIFDMLFNDDTCATVTVDKVATTTQISSRGYNTCSDVPRRVERGLRVRY